MNFQNKTALITGGASGLGFLCGKCLAREGANVMLVDINQEALDRCVAEIAAYPANAAGAAIDVRDYQKVCAARDEAVARFGSIDILINCAGGAETRVCGVSGEFQDIPIDVYDFGIDVNLKGALYFDHAVLKQMAKQQSGVIIHLGSITGEEGCAVNVAYSASKSALMNGMTKSVTRPGMANMKTLMGRAAEPQEIADLILYLASDRAAFATGSSYLIDGGRNIMRNKE